MGCGCTVVLLLSLTAQWLPGGGHSKTGAFRLGWPQRSCPVSVRLLSDVLCQHRKYSVFHIKGLVLQGRDYFLLLRSKDICEYLGWPAADSPPLTVRSSSSTAERLVRQEYALLLLPAVLYTGAATCAALTCSRSAAALQTGLAARLEPPVDAFLAWAALFAGPEVRMSDISGHSSFLVLGNTASMTGMAADRYGWLTIAGRAMNNAGAPTSSKICSRTGKLLNPCTKRMRELHLITSTLSATSVSGSLAA